MKINLNKEIDKHSEEWFVVIINAESDNSYKEYFSTEEKARLRISNIIKNGIETKDEFIESFQI